MELKMAYNTDIGRKRTQNQDSVVARVDLGLFVVSDGMGGHQGGEIASSTSVDIIQNYVKKHKDSRLAHSPYNAKETIAKAIKSANRVIYEKSLKEAKLHGMGTTTTALLFDQDHLYIGHVGDSRCYFVRPQAIWQLTRDHSLVEEKILAGLITRDQARTDRMKNIITRSVGFEQILPVDVYEMEVQSGDCFLLCSDGLSGAVEDSEILEIINKELFELPDQGDIQYTVDKLIETANERGGDDNITTLIVQVA